MSTMTTTPQLDQTYQKVLAYVRNKIPDPDSYDLVQDSVLAFFSKNREHVESSQAYLFGIVNNKIKNYYSKQSKNAFHRVLVDFQHASIASLSTGLSTKVARKDDLDAALQLLPLRRMQAVELRYVQGLSLEEIAIALECSLATVKREIAAAKTALAERLGHEPWA